MDGYAQKSKLRHRFGRLTGRLLLIGVGHKGVYGNECENQKEIYFVFRHNKTIGLHIISDNLIIFSVI